MGEVVKALIDDEEKQAKAKIWEYALGFTPMAVVKCAIQLQIADVLQTHGGPITLHDLSAAVHCSPPVLHRIMRYLINRGFFKQTLTAGEEESSISYTQTPLSKLLIKNGENSMAALILLESSSVMLGPWHKLSSGGSEKGPPPFEAEHGVDIWEYASANPAHSKLIDDAMGCIARMTMGAIFDRYPEAFAGIGSLVDVGGGDGTTLRTVVKACPWIRGINFDLPHVVCVAPQIDGIEHVAGNMFDAIPKADAAILVSVLHDWSDEECIEILKKCREAIPLNCGKVMIVEAVIQEGEVDNDCFMKFKLTL
ncbi:hypothetical protein ACS0TY_001741 [Phlomoides rotata]